MKNLDIEKLERKNIYTTPNNFFENVQENVLQETVYKIKKQPSIDSYTETRKLNWWYAAAAAVAMIFGATFFFNDDEKPKQTIAQKIASENTKTPTSKGIIDIENNQNHNISEKISKIDHSNFETPYSSNKKLGEIIKASEKKQIIIAQNVQQRKELSNAPKAEEQVEMILASLSNEEVAAISKNTEQDVYLDLYN